MGSMVRSALNEINFHNAAYQNHKLDWFNQSSAFTAPAVTVDLHHPPQHQVLFLTSIFGPRLSVMQLIKTTITPTRKECQMI